MVSYPKNLFRPNLGTQIANTSKINLSRGSFCKFKDEAPIFWRQDSEFRGQLPKKPIVDQIWRRTLTKQPKPQFDWSLIVVLCFVRFKKEKYKKFVKEFCKILYA